MQLTLKSVHFNSLLGFALQCMLPSEVATRMVVAEDIGLSLFLDHTGEYVVSYVLPESLAAEYEKIQPGDVVREIEGVLVHRKPV